MSFLLMALLTLVCFFERYPAPPWNGSPLIPLGLAMLGMGVVAGHAFWISRAFTSPSSKDRAFPFDLLTTFEKRRYRHQILQMAIFLACLVFLGWGWAVRQLWSSGAGELPGLELLLLAPFLLGQLASWLCFYDADQAVHSAINYGNDGNSWSHSWLDARSPASRAFAGRWSYVALQARQTFALVLIPVALLILQKELGRLLPASWRQSSELVTGLGLGSLALVIFFMPLILRVILGLRPIPDGPLRHRLEKTSQRLGFRCSNLLLWNTQMGMANAMVIGLSPWLRYVVFTDRLIEDFSPEEVEAVLGHEIGHIRHRHMPTYLLFLSGSMVVLGLLADHYFLPAMASAADSLVQSNAWLPSWLPDQLGPGGDLGSVPIAIGMLLYIFGIFGYLSRGCERQADIVGCRAVSCSNPVCQSHEEDILLPDRGGHLCPTGIRTFIRALNQVALINGISRDRPGFLQSWQHSTIERRVSFLERMLFNPRVELQFQRGLLAVKVVLLGGLGIGLGILTHLHGWPW